MTALTTSERNRRSKERNPAKRRAQVRASVQTWRAAHPEVNAARLRANRYQREYGITVAQYEEMVRLQGGVCAICGKAPTTIRLHADHDHKTRRVRGALCFYCNRYRLGRSRDCDAHLHRRMADYLASTFDARAL